jgi:hypothetical protein
MDSIPVYWINLERDVERRTQRLGEFSTHGIRHTRIEGILHTSPKIGCCLSHIHAIYTAYRDGCEYAIIAEDDAVWYSDSLQNIRTLVHSANITVPNWEVLQLHYINPQLLVSMMTIPSVLQTNVFLKGYFMSGAAYLICRKGIERFLHTMVRMHSNTYEVRVSLDHPRAAAEELIYRYLQSYCSLLPVINVLEMGYSNIAEDPNQVGWNTENMILVNYMFARWKESPVSYSASFVYELPYDQHWHTTSEEADATVYTIEKLIKQPKTV